MSPFAIILGAIRSRWLWSTKLSDMASPAQLAGPTFQRPRFASTGLLPLGLVALSGVLLAIALLSLRVGSLGITTADAWNALFHYNPDNYAELVVRTLRLPRTLYAIVLGAGLGLSGTIAQAITRNPLADPSILGVSSGATFAVVIAVYFFGLTAPYQYVWFAFVGALLASLLVFVLSASGRARTATPTKVALAGIVISAMLFAWTSALLLLDRETMDVVRFWMAGSVAGSRPRHPLLVGAVHPRRIDRRSLPRAPAQRAQPG